MTQRQNQEYEFETLRRLLASDEWPAAVPAECICNPASETEKFERAEGILDLMLEEHLQEKAFLDFGCGEGHAAIKALGQSPRISVGYDIVVPNRPVNEWNARRDRLLLTSSLEQVAGAGPFDVVLMYDVLDHIDPRAIDKALLFLEQVCADNARVYIRCHPWTSRHGSHQYQQCNKAFLHLVFTEEELRAISVKLDPVEAHARPQARYRRIFPPEKKQWRPRSRLIGNSGRWIREFGANCRRNLLEEVPIPMFLNKPHWKFSQRRIQSIEVEPFFIEHSIVRNRILKRLGFHGSARLPLRDLRETFYDYVVTLPAKQRCAHT